MSSAHILVVDDDAELRRMLRQLLSKADFVVTTVASGDEMWRVLAERPADLIILDLHLEGEHGLDLARRLRVEGEVPILILTALGDQLERVVGIEMGADDYVVKPFHARELLGRVKNLLRRTWRPSGSVPATIRIGSLVIDPQQAMVRHGNGHRVDLSAGDLALLRLLAARPGAVLSREELMAHAEGVSGRSIDLRIARLRRKLRAGSGDRDLIQTVRGRGYRLVPD